jgi:hypothetical protein
LGIGIVFHKEIPLRVRRGILALLDSAINTLREGLGFVRAFLCARYYSPLVQRTTRSPSPVRRGLPSPPEFSCHLPSNMLERVDQTGCRERAHFGRAGVGLAIRRGAVPDGTERAAAHQQEQPPAEGRRCTPRPEQVIFYAAAFSLGIDSALYWVLTATSLAWHSRLAAK